MEPLKLNGLRAKILSIDYLHGRPGHRLLAASLDADDIQLARLHSRRPFELHVSIAYEWQLSTDDTLAIDRLNKHWAGAEHVFWAQWIGAGATAQLHPRDLLIQDPDFIQLFKLNNPHISM